MKDSLFKSCKRGGYLTLNNRLNGKYDGKYYCEVELL